ncbi:MAG: TetR/AcrR family transcriptional regulator [Lactobacillaceae bacterium]|jgi:AcrR family transcriptional regulator|nr:TetR/AcrR family transcriptional regulator [Lactobacillaceae bacterium]
MKILSEELILTTAERLIEQHGMENVTLSSVAAELGMTHAALYKYYKNKNDLWGALSIKWLDNVLVETFAFDGSKYTDKKVLLHDWLWTFVNAKRGSYQQDAKMFALYTAYVDGDPALLDRHLNALATKLTALMGWDQEASQNIILAFTWFAAPAFAPAWLRVDFAARFESLWTFTVNGIDVNK